MLNPLVPLAEEFTIVAPLFEPRAMNHGNELPPVLKVPIRPSNMTAGADAPPVKVATVVSPASIPTAPSESCTGKTLPVVLDDDVDNVHESANQWPMPVLFVHGEPVAGTLTLAAQRASTRWPHVLVIMCPNMQRVDITAKRVGAPEFIRAPKSNLRRISSVADAVEVMDVLCLEISLFNRVESDARAQSIPDRARVMVIDPKRMDDSNRAVTRWYKQQQQTVLFTASMDTEWVRQGFHRPGVYVGRGRTWQREKD